MAFVGVLKKNGAENIPTSRHCREKTINGSIYFNFWGLGKVLTMLGFEELHFWIRGKKT